MEKLDFRGSALGRQMSRVLTNCGRGAVARELADLADRYGIEIHEIDPAYTSKTDVRRRPWKPRDEQVG